MRILITVHGLPPELRGGTEHAVESLAHALADRGHEVTLLAGSDRHAGRWHEEESQLPRPGAARGAPGLRVVRLQRDDLYYLHWQKALHPGVSAAFRALLLRERPDVVHVNHWLRLSRDLVATAAETGVPAVVTLHDMASTCLVHQRVRPDTREVCDVPLGPDPCLACAAALPPRTPWRARDELVAEVLRHRAEMQRELLLARAVVVLSVDQARVLRPHVPPVPLHVVPPPDDDRLARRPPLPPPAEHGRLVMTNWSGLHPLKGADLLVDALARLHGEGRAVELKLAGSDCDARAAGDLRARARGLPVTFLGPFDAAALQGGPVGEAHVFAGASFARETWGLVADEAAALGLPLVLPRRGAPAERYGEDRGALLYEAGDVEALAAALRRLLDEPGLLAALRARLPARGALRPAPDAVARSMLSLYEEAVALGPPPVPPRAPDGPAQDLAALRRWDLELARCTPAELGFG